MSDFLAKIDRQPVQAALGPDLYAQANAMLTRHCGNESMAGDAGKVQVRDLILQVDSNQTQEARRGQIDEGERKNARCKNEVRVTMLPSNSDTFAYRADTIGVIQNGSVNILLKPPADVSEHLPELALAYAEDKFDRIHEAGNGPDQITKPDLEAYERTHKSMGPLAKILTHYLENNFDVIRGVDPSAEGGFLGIGTHSATGITLSDLQKGRKLISNTLEALNVKPDTPQPESKYSVSAADVQFLQSHFSEIPKTAGDKGIDKFEFDQYLSCGCQTMDKESLERLQLLSSKFQDIVKMGDSSGSVLTASGLQRALENAQQAEHTAQEQLTRQQEQERQEPTNLSQRIVAFYDYSKL